jgi:hypothetical protein
MIEPRGKDLGGFSVRRILPYAKRRMVGPFIFLDHMGPAQFAAGQGMDVRPHPHIGLATVTYLFEGEIHHRDTLGTSLAISPGAVTWMTAGRGIATLSAQAQRSARGHTRCMACKAGWRCRRKLKKSHRNFITIHQQACQNFRIRRCS